MNFTCFPSVKANEEQNSDKISCIMLAEANQEWVKKFEINDVKRTSEYKNFKNKIEQNMLEILYLNFPQLKGKIEYINLGTPLTNKNYYNRYSSYGMKYDIKRSNDSNTFLNCFTNCKGLFLTG